MDSGGSSKDEAINCGAREDEMGKQPEEKTKRIVICEVVALIATIGFVWMLLVLPIIFYHLPDEVYYEPKADSSSGSSVCSSAIPYDMESGVCQDVLQNTLLAMNCEPGEPLLVLRDDETNARQLLYALSLSPSPECKAEAIPLLCLHLFGLCDSSGVSIQPTSGQCRNIRDNICQEEWQTAELFGFELPNCELFPEELTFCSARNQSSIPTAASLNSTDLDVWPCQENFFRPDEEADICVANCSTWSESSPSIAFSTDLVIALSAVIGLVTGMTVIGISLLRFKQVFVFPSIFVVYMTCDVIVIAFFVTITFFDRPSLYCSSENLQTSLVQSTPFCVLTGMTLSYTLLQLALWWLFHITALLWKVGFPLHARSFEMSGKTKYIHIGCIVVGVVIPLVPVIATMVNFASEVHSDVILQAANATFVSGGLGYRMDRFPPILCSGTSGAVVYYSNILPINLVFFVGITELILLFAIVHKRYGFLMEKKSIASHFKIGTPEKKVLMALCYYVLLMAFALPSFTIFIRVSGRIKEQLLSYFLCEERGVDPDNPGRCDEFRDALRDVSYRQLMTVSYFFLHLLPIVFLIYTVNFEELKGKLINYHVKLKRRVDSLSHSEMKATQITVSH